MNKIRVLILAGLFALASWICRADSQPIGGQWRGLNNADASIQIADNEAQSLQDVDITDNASGIKKRSGYTQFRTIGVSTWSVRGGYYYRDTSGNDTIIHANDRSIYKSVNSAAYSAFITTDTAGSYQDFTDSQGNLWRANNNRDEIFSYSGSAVTYYPSLPKGNQIEATPTRLVISGTTANPNRIHKSAQGSFSNFTTGSLDTDPYTEDIGLPGQSIQAIKSACGGVLAWTKDSLSLDTSETQYDLRPIIGISNTIGTNQPYSIVNDLGVTYWQGQDRHFYSYDCNGIRDISRKVDTSNIVTGEVRNWATTTQGEFQAGTIGTGLSATISPGDIVMQTSVYGESYQTSTGDIGGASSTLQDVGQSFYSTTTLLAANIGLSLYKHPFNTGSTWTGTIRSNTAGSPDTPGSTIYSTFTVSGSVVGDTSGPPGTFYDFELTPEITLTANTTYWIYMSDNGSGSANQFTWDENLAAGYSRGGTYNDSYGYGNADFLFRVTTVYPSGTYQSEAFNIGTAITSWGSVDIGNVLNSGVLAYAIYTDTNSSITISDTGTWTSSRTVTSGQIPDFATAPYVTWTANFSRTVSTQTPILNDLTINWFEGAITKHWGSIDKDHRIIWSVAEGTATVPNVSYIYDVRFDSWLKYSFPMDAAAKVGDSLYFGGVSTGIVYKWPSGNTDAGSAITAFWKSKDFIVPDPFIEKDFMSYSFVTKAQTGSNLDILYTINTSSTVTNNYSLTDTNGNTFRRINANLPSGKFGTFFNIRFGNDDGDSPFQVYALKYDYKPKPWRVMP